MKINSGEFCYLSTSETFLGWLYQYAPEMHTGLIKHLQQSKGCRSNRDKMMDIFGKIQKDRPLAESLAQFIQDHFPQLITGNNVESASSNLLNRHNVFSHYDPSLTSFPRRIILEHRPESDIQRDILTFCARQGYCEHIIVEDRAYIEYLLPEHAILQDKIPSRNWEVRAYKRANGLE
jgi:hypothetical protein